ncbi:MAG: FG-GAP-like repeat-containing protein [Sphingobacteriales bacterium]|nr:FG-GAP-like repeat-containing protein [Sphingobacteriales bacterium]
MRKIIFLFVAILASSLVQAQVCNAPVVNSFTPNTGFIGSTVTITGANFDPIPANNQVYFGSVKANIISSSFGTIVVAVPTGANTAPIAVKNGCNKIGYSSVAFNGIFCPTPVTASTYQNSAFILSGIVGAYNMLAQDLDLDGKPDVITMTYGGITVARNNSTPGNLNFVAHTFSFGGSSIATADFDGDGKRDLMYPGAIARNTSTGPGNINFAPVVGAGVTGYQTACGDFNNDGRVDVVSESGGQMYVTFNTSSGPGVISFGSPMPVGNVGSNCTGMQVADIDGDGRVDIMASQGNANRSVSLRNNTTPGATSAAFETPEFWPSNGSYPYRAMIADFNKDGKIDFTTCNFNAPANTAIYRNTSTVGDINFAATVNLPAPSGNYRIGVGDINGDGFTDIVTKATNSNTFSVYPNTSAANGSVTFSSRFDYSSSAAAEVSGIVIGDLDGDFVPDIATSGTSSGAIRFHRNTSSQVDNLAPNAVCKNITVALSPTGTAVVTAAMIDNGSGDACGLGSIQIDNATTKTFTCADIGANTVTLKVTDIAGNFSTCNAVVTVAPAAIIVAGQTTVCQGQTIPMVANLGDSYQWYNNGVLLAGETNQQYIATVSGAYTVAVTNAGGCSGISAATNVVVNNNPTISTFPTGSASLCPPSGNLTITASLSSIYQWQKNGVNIANATQQTLTVNSVGTYTVSVIDLFGCSATSAPIVVGSVDNVNPILVTNNITVALNASESASTTLAALVNAYSDNCSNVTLSFVGQTSYSCSDIGNTIAVSITATDGSGNTTTQVANVTVTDPNSYCNAAPVAVCQNLTVDAVGVTANADATAFNNGSTDPDGDVITYSVAPAGPYALGTTAVVLTAADPAGLTSTCNATITVVDNTNPTVVAQNVTIALDANGAASTTAAAIDNGSSDNVGIVSLTLSNYNFTCANLGPNTVTLYATDAAGNSDSATATVTVVDAIAPVANGQNIVVQLDANGSATVQASQFNLGSTDNCSIANLDISKTSFDCTNVGVNNLTFTVTDGSGNSSSTQVTVLVQDVTAPIITASTDQVFCEESNGTYTIQNITATDNCAVTTTFTTITGATSRFAPGLDASGVFAVGTSTVTWTVMDAMQNTSTSSITVTINPAPVASLSSSTADAFCNEVTLTAASTNAGPYSYAWSTGEITQSITLGLADADGIYTVYVTDANGCNSLTAASYNYQKQTLTSSYSILAYKEVELEGTNIVQSGSVGVMRATGEAEFEKGVSVVGVGSFTKSPKYKTKGTVTITNKITGVATVALPTMQSYAGTTNNLPSYTVNKNNTVTLNSNYKDLTVKKGANATINGSVFRKVTIEEGATVKFTSAVVNIEDLSIGKASSSLTRVRFAGNTSIRIKDRVKIEGNAIVNQDNYQVTFYFASTSGCNEGDEDKFSVKGGNTTIVANVLIPNGKIKVENEGDDDDDDCHGSSNAGTSIYMTGLYVGNTVKGDGKNIYWNTYSCVAAANREVLAEVTPSIAEEGLLNLIVFPNPATTSFNFKLETMSEEKVSFRIFDVAGRLVFENSDANANELYNVGETLSSGVYMVEAAQGTERKVLRVVKTN